MQPQTSRFDQLNPRKPRPRMILLRCGCLVPRLRGKIMIWCLKNGYENVFDRLHSGWVREKEKESHVNG